jgi:hypothetical protein
VFDGGPDALVQLRAVVDRHVGEEPGQDEPAGRAPAAVATETRRSRDEPCRECDERRLRDAEEGRETVFARGVEEPADRADLR